MSSNNVANANLDLAKSLLLEPFGLDERALIKAMSVIFTHQVELCRSVFPVYEK